MKTIKLTDNQFETLFHFVDERVEDIVDRSVQFQDSEILEDWEEMDYETVEIKEEEIPEPQLILSGVL